MMTDTLYIVFWEDILTGASGHGSAMSAEAAQAWADEMNNKYAGTIQHWLELAPKTEPEAADG
jgi:hypothetical protein